MDSSKNSNAVIFIINYQHLRISIAMVISPRYTNVTRRGTSRCKKTTAFGWAVLQHGLLWSPGAVIKQHSVMFGNQEKQ